MAMHILFEHATGYALFRVKEFEEIGLLQAEVEDSVLDISRFNSVVKLVAFSAFRSGPNALDNINSISEGICHPDLQAFLENNLPKSSKKQKTLLGLADAKLAGALSESMHVACMHTGVVPEIIRGIRLHFPRFVKGLTDVAQGKAQLGLGHSYSRCKVKFNVNRSDNMIIQAIALLDQLDKDVNTFSMRIREWYSYHFPELVKIVNDNYTYARVAQYIGNRKLLTEERLEGLEEIIMDSSKARAIYDASRASMGMDISPIDLINIESFSRRVISLAEFRKMVHTYLRSKMELVAPNLATLIGEQVGARLISHAGSLTNLAKYPASTVQILGAEKALFRALKTKTNTPKYGLIFHSTFIGRAGAKNKGRISRFLANKCSIASRIDCFADVPTTVYGEHLKEQVENRLKFYETGETPAKNIDVMSQAEAEAAAVRLKLAKKEKKRQKKLAKLAGSEGAATTTDSTMEESCAVNGEETQAVEKKKKKKKDRQSVEPVESELADVSVMSVETPATSEKKKKKRKSSMSLDAEVETDKLVSAANSGESPVKKMKKKKKEKVADDDDD
jgi:RNA processing factor Prp31